MTRALRLRPFRRLALGYGVNALGNYVAEVALTLLVYRRAGTATAVAVMMVAGQLLPACVGPVLVARLERVQSARYCLCFTSPKPPRSSCSRSPTRRRLL
jgi:hypothetical protein